MALKVCLLGDGLTLFFKKSTPNVILTALPFSIVIFTCGFNIGSLNVSFPQVR